MVNLSKLVLLVFISLKTQDQYLDQSGDESPGDDGEEKTGCRAMDGLGVRAQLKSWVRTLSRKGCEPHAVLLDLPFPPPDHSPTFSYIKDPESIQSIQGVTEVST